MDLKTDLKSLIGKEDLVKNVDPKKYVTELTGEHTIRDILNELRKPGLDPRSELEPFEFANIYKIEDVKVGMIIPGQVTNITRFGAFVDIGVKQDGLVHVSEIANRYITDPNQVLKLNDKVQVKVTEVDLLRKRIALSIKQAVEGVKPEAGRRRHEAGGVKPEAGSRRPEVGSLKPKAEGGKREAGGARLKTSDVKIKPAPTSMEDALNALKKKFKN
jgi:uncharacterized protein